MLRRVGEEEHNRNNALGKLALGKASTGAQKRAPASLKDRA